MKSIIKVCAGVLASGVLAAALIGPRARGDEAPATQPSAAPAFTEDFESGELNKDIWTLRVNVDATIAVQHEEAAHGKNALHVHYATPRSYAFAVTNKLPASVKDHLFGRAYVKFPTPLPPGHILFITTGTEGWPISNFMEIGNRQNKAQLSYQQNGANIPRGEKMIAGPAYPVGKWFCLEWEYNDKPDSIAIWIDGEKVTDSKVEFQNVAENLVKGFAELGLGFRSWNNAAGTTFDVYYDDVAIGTSRIGPVK